MLHKPQQMVVSFQPPIVEVNNFWKPPSSSLAVYHLQNESEQQFWYFQNIEKWINSVRNVSSVVSFPHHCKNSRINVNTFIIPNWTEYDILPLLLLLLLYTIAFDKCILHK